jgi:hypothetical protein
MKNAVFWVIETQFVQHRRHITSPTERNLLIVCKIWRFTAVTMKNTVSWDVRPCGSCNRGFGRTRRIHHHGGKKQVFLPNVLLLLVTANVVPSPLTPTTLMREVILSSEKSSYKIHTESDPRKEYSSNPCDSCHGRYQVKAARVLNHLLTTGQILSAQASPLCSA